MPKVKARVATYKVAVRKTKRTPTRVRLVRCNPIITGIGRIKMKISSMMDMAADAISHLRGSPHLMPTVRSHCSPM